MRGLKTLKNHAQTAAVGGNIAAVGLLQLITVPPVSPQMSSEVTGRLKEATQDFKAQLPVIVELGNPAMRSRHWQKLFKAMNQPYYPDLVFSLSELLDHGVAEHAELIGELSAAASGEEQLKESLVNISKASVFSKQHCYFYHIYLCGKGVWCSRTYNYVYYIWMWMFSVECPSPFSETFFCFSGA